MVMSSTANGNATCHYRQEALDESTGDLGLSIYGEGLLLRQSFLTLQGMFNILFG